MFGYIRAYKPYMRVFEYEIYKSVYCGVCKDMGRRLGNLTRFSLTYDSAFLALFEHSVRGTKVCVKNERCIAHPWKKTMCAGCGNDFSYASYVSALLVWHKLKDDMLDGGVMKKLISAAGMLVFRKAYKKANAQYPTLSREISGAMELQRAVEQEKCAGIDQASEPTAMIMRSVFTRIGRNKKERELLARFGYCLGRFVYITDALDDLRSDVKSCSYNPLVTFMKSFGIEWDGSGKLPREVQDFCTASVNMTLGQLADCYVALDPQRFRDILDNIIYLGLKNTFRLVREEKFRKGNNSKKGKTVI